MYNLFLYFVLFLFSIYTFIKIVFYAKYEKTTNNNRVGAIVLIAFTLFSIIISSVFVLLNQ